MIIKNSINLSRLGAIFASVILIINLAISGAFAIETPDSNIGSASNAERGRQIMSQMMGGNYNSMDDFMDQMMGENNTQSMYEMMGKINASGLTASDTRPLSDFMNACRSQSSNNYGFGGMMGNWNWGGMMGTGLGVGGLFLALGGIIMIVFWVIIILAAIALLRWLINYLQGKNNSASSHAMEILKEKYAKGEITKEEFEIKKIDLM